MASIPKNIRLAVFIPIIFCLFSSCTETRNELPAVTSVSVSRWYRQAVVDLGSRIVMTSPTNGFAISRGIGNEVQGHAYRLSGGEWKPFYDFQYSDYPLIGVKDSLAFLTVNHLTHAGAYRPIVSEYKGNKRSEILLPKIMWDEIDYVMFKGLYCFGDGTAWMVGQQGHILYYDGSQWHEKISPLFNPHKSTITEGDLNDIAMTSKMTGWAVGRNGAIIRCVNGEWKQAASPTDQVLQKISMANDSTGWAVGNGGTILECRNYHWRIIPFDTREQLNSVYVFDSTDAWIVGTNSTLLSYDGKEWKADRSIKTYDDNFSDISAVKDSTGLTHIWLIGDQGIYTNSQSLGVSFTDITGSASLRRIGKLGTFFVRSKSSYPDLLVANDGGSSLLYENNEENIFSDVTSDTKLISSPRDAAVMAFGDMNNDGETDILQVIDQKKFTVYLGTSGGGFRDWTERSGLQFDEINSIAPVAAKFIDLDNDGDLDLYLSNSDLSDQLFLNDGAGRFAKISAGECGILKILNHSSYGAVFGDFNNDGRIDIFIPYYISYKNKFFSLFLNQGGMKFKEVDDSLFYSRTDLSPTAVAIADFNNDGNIDLFIHSQKFHPLLWVNDGTGHFRDISADAGFTALYVHPEPINGIVSTADINNDGYIDVFEGSKLFLNSAGMKFSEVSERVGIQFIGTATFSDIDNDGDMDLFIGSGRGSLGKGDRAALFRNNVNDANFVKVRIRGDASNRMGIGTKILLVSGSGMTQTRVVGFGSNQLGVQNLDEVHFGIHPGERYSLKIIFPSGREQTIPRVMGGSVITRYESNVVQHHLILLSKSLYRTILMVNRTEGGVKVLSLLMLLGAIVLAGQRVGVGKFSRRWYFLASVSAIYVLSVHLSIQETFVMSTFFSVAGTLVFGTISLGAAKVVIERREAKYISHYKILELLGQGGMGKVYRAVDSNTKKIVALKVLNPELLKDAENKKRLSAEGHLLSSFDHPNIVKVYEVSETAERGFIAMEYLTGGTLRELLEKHHPLPFDRIQQYLIQVCDGLTEVHRNGIVHRDLKSGNLMLGEDGTVRIMDFGLSKSPLVTTMTSLGTVLGTLGYVAPEQVTSLDVDRRTDIFSLGVIMYELVTGELPFKGENEIALIHSIFNVIPPLPSLLRNDVPKEWDAVIMQCLAKDPNERFNTAGEVKDQFIIHNS